jgi:hypothetical protein
MKIKFVEDIDLALRRRLPGRVIKHQRFKEGQVYCVEFLGEDSDHETIDIEFADGSFGLSVPRSAVNLQPE